MTIQRQIRDAIAALLTPLPGVNVFRSPRRVLAAGELPAVCIFSQGDRPQEDDADHAKQHWRVYTVRVEIRVPALPEDDATDYLAVEVRRALLADDTLGGLVDRITWTEQAWDGDEADAQLGGTALDFACFYLWRPE